MGQFGQWWAARNQVQLDTLRGAGVFRVEVSAPQSLAGLTLEVPAGWRLAQQGTSMAGVEQQGTAVLLPVLQGKQTLLFTPGPTAMAAQAAPKNRPR